MSTKRYSPEWRLGRGWSERELEQRLVAARERPSTGPANDEEAMSPEWRHYYSEASIAAERPGPPEPGGPFDRARVLVTRYTFSDPRIVVGHFDPEHALLERRMLLEIKVMGLHYLCGVIVGAVRDEASDERTIWGYRYDTLLGHIESGSEWFLLTKNHQTGDVRFRIQAAWRPGEFPNWWSRLGFAWFARRYQRAWHRLSYLRLREFLESRGLPPLAAGEHLLHEGLDMAAKPPIASVAGREKLPEVRVEAQN